ncbi:hydrogenase maturation protease [Saccharopolyspora phatthalungensis]|uniref:Hydrogenase maturation protease n=1 Tax=Saccharopolyspora phatthalungensis TaxID=664693 RepID=A0A840QB99_9PSEU|nr:hydrogenase maturation protease [Saccharopolyspora phatthalungensis]MBB5157080.1 hydrogenase maturation protease [Saccharopolyspora phatthalungensis]
MTRVLLAGIGNIFHGDDGFGSAVAARLDADRFPEQVDVGDYGIRGVHLAYQLLEGYDLVVLVDAVQRGAAPGTLHVIEHQLEEASAEAAVPAMDAHDLSPDAVLALVRAFGGTLKHVVVVGCEPESVEVGMGLSPVVQAAVDEAARVATDLALTAFERGEEEPCASASQDGS